MTNNLQGVLTALATPFDTNEEIDFDMLRTLVDRSINGGVDGVVAGGSTGEFASLSSTERQQVIEVVVEHTNGRVPVIAQTGATTVREAKRLSNAAVFAGADVLMLVTPYYEPLSLDETVAYIKEIASSVDVPIMLYNIPDATGVNLDVETVAELASTVDNVRYIKDSSADYEQALRLIRYVGDKLGIIIGWDVYLYSALAEGAAGIMAGSANVFPEELVKVARLVRTGELAAAGQAWGSLYPAIDALLGEPFVAAVKAGLRLQGVAAGLPRQPMADVSDVARDKIAAALQGLGRQVQV